jgi:hypothetical protein
MEKVHPCEMAEVSAVESVAVLGGPGVEVPPQAESRRATAREVVDFTGCMGFCSSLCGKRQYG